MSRRCIWLPLGIVAMLPSGSAVAQSPAGRSFMIGGEAFQEADLTDARATPELDGGASIMLSFTPVAAKRIAVLSSRHLGQPVVISLDGDRIAALVITTPINDGVLLVTGTFALSEAETIARRISGHDPLPEDMAE